MQKKIAIIVPNDCNPDYRVIKQAELFSDYGHEVRVYCRYKRGLPKFEKINGVTYMRRSITLHAIFITPLLLYSIIKILGSAFKNLLNSLQYERKPNLKEIRLKNIKTLKEK